jgi:hypothetical protein
MDVDEKSCDISLGSEEDSENLEWVEVLVKRQHASYLQSMSEIEAEENDIEWEEEEPPLKRARIDDETFNV